VGADSPSCSCNGSLSRPSAAMDAAAMRQCLINAGSAGALVLRSCACDCVLVRAQGRAPCPRVRTRRRVSNGGNASRASRRRALGLMPVRRSQKMPRVMLQRSSSGCRSPAIPPRTLRECPPLPLVSAGHCSVPCASHPRIPVLCGNPANKRHTQCCVGEFSLGQLWRVPVRCWARERDALRSAWGPPSFGWI